MAGDIRIHCSDHTSNSVGRGGGVGREGRWQMCGDYSARWSRVHLDAQAHTYIHEQAHTRAYTLTQFKERLAVKMSV